MDQRFLMASAQYFDGCAGDFAFSQPSPLFELLDRFIVNIAPDPDKVSLGHFIPRVHQLVCQLAIIGEDNKAGGIGIEPADTEDALAARDKIYSPFPALRVTVGANHALWLIQKKIDLLFGANLFTVDGDDIFFGVNEDRQRIYYMRVHGNSAVEYQFFALSARVDTGGSQNFLESLLRHYALTTNPPKAGQ
jgi:hypothetical protein